MTTKEDSTPGATGRADSSSADKASVLLVDDRHENLVAFETVLARSGNEIVTARSGAEALEKAFRKTFAVIVMDVRMPILGGFETAAILRRREMYRVTPIIFTSAYAVAPKDMAGSYVAGATDFIETPADGELLKYKVDAFVRLHFRTERTRRRAQEVADDLESLKAEVAKAPQDRPLLDRLSRLEHSLLRLEEDLGGKA